MMKQTVLIASSLLLAMGVCAADKAFDSTDGSWGDEANWKPAGVPVDGDKVTIPSGKTCRVGEGVTTAYAAVTISQGGALSVEGGTLRTSDKSTYKNSLTISGDLTFTGGTIAVHDFSIAATGKADLQGGSLSVFNNMYNNAATTETTGLHIGQSVSLAAGYWNYNALGGVISGLSRSLGEFRLPTSTDGKGSLLITNSTLCIDKLGIAYHLSGRNNLFGHVDIVDADVTVGTLNIAHQNITGKNTRELFVGSNGTLSFTGSQGWTLNAADVAAGSSFLCRVGGEGVENARLIVTNTSKQVKSLTVADGSTLDVAQGGSVTASKAYLKNGGTLRVEGSLPCPIECQRNGVVEIDGGAVTGDVACAAGGRVTANGGIVSCSHIASAATHAAETANLSFGGGAEIYARHLVAGGTTVSGANVATDKEISPTVLVLGDCRLHCAETYCYLHVGAQSTQNVGRVVFDGCKMDPCNGTNYKWYLRGNGLGTSEIVIRGSQNELYFQHMEGTNALIRYVFDASRDHVSPLRYERTGHPEAVGPIGVLDLQVDGGAMLTAGTSFDLIVSAAAMDLAQMNYSSTPWSRGSTLWSGTLAESGKRYRVTLNVDAERAPGSDELAFGTARTTGAIAIPVGATDGLESLQVRLNLENATDERLAALVDALRAAGYPASAADKAKTGYDLTVSFSAGQVTPNAANYFVWDFTSAGAASTGVTSLRVVKKDSPSKFYLHYR